MTTSPVSEILVPLDGMDPADGAIDVAARLAAHRGARLHIVSVLRPPADLDAIARDALDEHLRLRAEKTATAFSVATVHAVLEGPESVADQLATYARRHAIDLVVMRSRGRSTVGAFCFGSVGAALLERSELPCLLLRDRGGQLPATRPGWTYSRMLVPLDGTPEAEAGIEQAVALAVRGLTDIRLLVVVPDRWIPAPGIGLAPPGTAELATAAAYVEELAHRLEIRGFRASGLAVARASVTAAIAECIEAQQIDLVSICSHHRSEGDRLIFGSVIDALVHGTRVPVLARRTTRAEAADLAHAARAVQIHAKTAVA
jgi:nucleotide-binding universal stress UspA family protein